MTLPRSIVIPGMLQEYEAFGSLLRSLSAEEWATPSRCGDWTAGDVAAHVVSTLTDVANLRLDGLGTPEVTERQVIERRGRTPDELADELEQSVKLAGDLVAAFDDAAWAAPAPGGVDGTLGFGLESLWYDTYVHGDDIRAAVGRPSERTDALRPSLEHVAEVLTRQGWRPSTLAFDGFDEVQVSGGGGERITGDALDFVLVATGRKPADAFGLDETVNIYR